jgi:hypothetical protein
MLDIRNAVNTLSTIKDCAVKAGIYESWFVCFGTLLGAVRPTLRKWGGDKVYMTGIMEHDDDMDVGILSDKVTKEQEENYAEYMKEAGLTRVRGEQEGHKMRRKDTGRLVWMTIRQDRYPATKCCNWFWQRWNGHYWHSKGTKWVGHKFDVQKYKYKLSDEAIMLGVPEKLFNGLTEIDFDGIKINVPTLAGSCCDLWYPGWFTPVTGGTSARSIIARVPKWADGSTWNMLPGVIL